MRYYQSFRTVIPHFGVGHQRVTHPFATRILSYCYKSTSFDLHVLGTPPAFILSQDQTLRKKFFTLASGCLRIFYWIDKVVASYHYSVVKVRVTKRAAFYTSRLGLSRHQQTKTPMSLSFDIGSSDCKTHRLVSLTRDFSVFIDLSGGRDLVECTGECLLYVFSSFCQEVIRQLTLKIGLFTYE